MLDWNYSPALALPNSGVGRSDGIGNSFVLRQRISDNDRFLAPSPAIHRRASPHLQHRGGYMSDQTTKLSGPDLTQAIALATIPDQGMLLGHVDGEPVLLARRGAEVFAIGAICTHYGAPLEQGLLVGDTVRCPWHHACFSLRTGEALRAPALDPVSRWRVEVVRDVARQRTPVDEPVEAVFVREKLAPWEPQPQPPSADLPKSVVIVGGGAAGNAAAEALRHEGYTGQITMLSADGALPCDRPNLSKGYLAGTASDASNLIRPAEFYTQHDIDLKLGARVVAIDTASQRVQITDGSHHDYDALLLATGAEPVCIDIPGADLPHVRYLRTLANSRALVAKSLEAKRAVVIGASFIGLEVAASLRARNIDVHLVGAETTLMVKVLGPDVGDYLRRLHEKHGVTFHLGTTAIAIDSDAVTLKSGERLPADLVVIGIGVQPMISLAQDAGIAMDRGVAVNEYLETSAPGIFAAGDIARWPDRLSGEHIRVEHWVVAERQGQVAAHNILGRRERFDYVPFFWTEQYDFSLAYVGHAERWDVAEIAGSLEAMNCTITYRLGHRELAKAFVHRDLDGLRTELEFEQRIAATEVGITEPPPFSVEQGR
jgi:NADPH-dependent 2,4-dienoyl-CoA reductase/sulfur reductase-like enzyme/nitrite reductase/ring-hydroxylating ferredoxin subunit